MIAKITPSKIYGTVEAIPSKSVAHRLLIMAAFADSETKIHASKISKDMEATVDCLSALGAKITYDAPYFHVKPIEKIKNNATLPCKESGSTFRFLLPLVATFGISATFLPEGRLPLRPLSPLYEELANKGISLSKQGTFPFKVEGTLENTDFSLSGAVSSQFISGLLFALALSGRGGHIEITGKLESSSYVELTLDALSTFGIAVKREKNGFTVPKNAVPHSKEDLFVEGDWSNAAFFLGLGAVSEKPVTVCKLNPHSPQGDRAILKILQDFGAKVHTTGEKTEVQSAPLHGISVDASEIPDLVPVIAALSVFAKGKTRIYNAKRLRMKESDRLQALFELLSAFGATVRIEEEALEIVGGSPLHGAGVFSYNDHRMAMTAAFLALFAEGESTITGAEAVSKSDEHFFETLKTKLHAEIQCTKGESDESEKHEH